MVEQFLHFMGSGDFLAKPAAQALVEILVRLSILGVGGWFAWKVAKPIKFGLSLPIQLVRRVITGNVEHQIECLQERCRFLTIAAKQYKEKIQDFQILGATQAQSIKDLQSKVDVLDERLKKVHVSWGGDHGEVKVG